MARAREVQRLALEAANKAAKAASKPAHAAMGAQVQSRTHSLGLLPKIYYSLTNFSYSMLKMANTAAEKAALRR